MKTVIVSNSDIYGGAARAAYRLFNGLGDQDMEILMAVKDKYSNHPRIFEIKPGKKPPVFKGLSLEDFVMQNIRQNRSELSDSAFSFPYPGLGLLQCPELDGADIINLHDVRGFQSVESIGALLESDIPVVWTLHDQSAFTGGCHYTAGCKKYRSDCMNCPQLLDHRLQLPHLVLINKLKYWKKNLTLVTPSRWLAGCVSASRVFADFRVETIQNSLDLTEFKAMDKKAAKKMAGIDPEAVVIMYNSLFHVSRRKGFDQFVNAVICCLKRQKFKSAVKSGQIVFIAPGETFSVPPAVPFKLNFLGKIDDNRKMAQLYSAADVFVLPSLEDNLPNTMLESMACATPVVAFAAGGIPEVVKSGENGFTVEVGNEKKMGKAIYKMVFDKKLRSRMGTAGAELIKNEFSLEIQAERYSNLFRELMVSLPAENRSPSLPRNFRDNKTGKTDFFVDQEFRKSINEF